MGEVAAVVQSLPRSGFQGEFHRSLTAQALDDLLTIEELRDVDPDHVLYSEGDAPSHLYIVLDGHVRLFVISPETGRRLIFRDARACELLGLASIFSGAVQDTTAQVVYPSVIASIRRQDFMNFLLRHPSAYRLAARELSRESHANAARLRTICLSHSTQSRLARLLIEWSRSGTWTNRGYRLHVPMTHVEVADCIGVSRETVTRSLGGLQRDRVVELRGSLMTILDMTELQNRSLG